MARCGCGYDHAGKQTSFCRRHAGAHRNTGASKRKTGRKGKRSGYGR